VLKKWRKSGLKPQWLAILLASAVLGFATPGIAMMQGTIPWLGNLETGLWEIKDRKTGDIVDKICIRDAKQLLQLRHSGPLCQREILRQDNSHAYVYYQCGAKGHGYTNIIMEGGGLMQITSQGLYDNSPFDFSAEARRIGKCSGK